MPGITSRACPPTPDDIDVDALTEDELDALLLKVETINGALRKNKRFSSPSADNMPSLQPAHLEDGPGSEKNFETTIEVAEVPGDLVSDDDTVSSLDGEELEASQSSSNLSPSIASDDDLDIFDTMTDEELDEHLSQRGPLMSKRDYYMHGPTKADLASLGTDETWDPDTGRIIKSSPPIEEDDDGDGAPIQDTVPDHAVTLLVEQTWQGSSCLAYEVGLARDFLKRFCTLPRPALAIAYNFLCAHTEAQLQVRFLTPELLLIAAVALAMAYTEDQPPGNEDYTYFCKGRYAARDIERATLDLFRILQWNLEPYSTAQEVHGAMEELFSPEVPVSLDVTDTSICSLMAQLEIDRTEGLRTVCKEHWAQSLETNVLETAPEPSTPAGISTPLHDTNN